MKIRPHLEQLLTLVRREFWEHKIAVLWVPAATAFMSAVFIVWLMNATITAAGLVDQINQMSAADIREQLLSSYGVIAFSVIAPLFITVPVYLLACLYDDRKNNSSLFWYSMPVSDTKTVLSKLLTALVLMPLSAFVMLTALVLFLLIVLAVFSVSSNIDTSILWTALKLLLQWLPWMLWSLLLAGLWLLPLYGWLLLVSAFARAVPFFWAIGVVIVLVIFESILFSSNHLSTWLGSRNMPFERFTGSVIELTVGFLDFEMLHGLIIGSLFVFGAIHMRRFAD
jgi:ABC-2 type transport system permease protein